MPNLDPKPSDGAARFRAVLAQRGGRQPSNEDLRQARENLCGFFAVLAGWSAATPFESVRADGDDDRAGAKGPGHDHEKSNDKSQKPATARRTAKRDR